MATPEQRSRAARIAVDISWSRTAIRHERTRPGFEASPLSREYWIARVRAEGIVCEAEIEKAADNAYRAAQRQRSMKAAKTRAANKAAREQQLQRVTA